MPRSSAREKLLRSGMQLIHDRSYHAVGIQQIAESAGVPKGSFYNHFATKEDFALVAIATYVEALSEFVRILEPTANGPSPRERVRRHFRAIGDDVASRTFRSGCLLSNLSAEVAGENEKIREALADVFSHWGASLQKCLEAAQKAGELPSTMEPQAMAQFLLNAWQGAMVRSKVERSSAAFQTFDTFVFETFWPA